MYRCLEGAIASAAIRDDEAVSYRVVCRTFVCGYMPVEDCWFTATLCVLVIFIDLYGESVSGFFLFRLGQVRASWQTPCRMQCDASSLAG